MEIEDSFSIEEDSQTTLTLDQRILALYQAGMTSPAQIFRRVSRSERVTARTIERKVNLLKERQSSTPIPRRPRQDKFLNDETRLEIEEYLQEHPFAIAATIIGDLEYDIGIRTMQRSLKELDCHYLPVKQAPLIMDQHKEDRVMFAEANMDRNWNNVLFVDECTFQSHACPQMAYQKEGLAMITKMPTKASRAGRNKSSRKD